MYRTAARGLLPGITTTSNSIKSHHRFLNLRTSVASTSRFYASQSFSDHNPNQNPDQIPRVTVTGTINQPDPTVSSSAKPASSEGETEALRRERQRPGGPEYQEEQARMLKASLRHVLRLGWTEDAMIAGARDVGISPSIVGSIPRKEAALVEFFMDECLQKLIDVIDSGEGLQNLVPSERISKLIRTRLEMQAPYISKWPQALSIQAHPSNVPTSIKQRAMLVDEIWHAAGDDGSNIDWYVKRTVLGGIYSTTEIYMLTDSSPDFRDTWVFLDDRVKDAFDLKKSIQEAKYLAEAVGAGLGNSLQGFVKRVFQG